MKTTKCDCRARGVPVIITTVSERVSGIGEPECVSKEFACSRQEGCDFRYDGKVCFLRHLQTLTE